MLGRDVVTSNSLYFGVGHLRPELDGGFKMPAPDQQTLNYRRRRPVAIVAGLAVSMLASIPVFAGAVSGTGPVTQPNPNTNSVQAYCNTNYPGTQAVVISTGSVSSGTVNSRTDQGYWLQWTEQYTPGSVEAQILQLRVGSATGQRLEYAAAFSWVGGNDTYIFKIGTAVQSNTIGGVPPADSLKMSNFNGKNFTQWGFCAYAKKVPVTITKTIAGGGSGNFVFTLNCTVVSGGATVSFAGYPVDVNVAVTTGPITVAAPSVPVGATCTAEEKAGAGDEANYTHEPKQTKTTTDPAGAAFSFLNTPKPKVGSFKIVKYTADSLAGTFNFSVVCGGVTLSANEVVSVVAGQGFSGISQIFTQPVGTSCTVTELPDSPDVYQEAPPQTFTVTESLVTAPKWIEFVNVRNP
jgi:hypothetical protein